MANVVGWSDTLTQPAILLTLLLVAFTTGAMWGSVNYRRLLARWMEMVDAEVERDEADYARTPEERAMLAQIRAAQDDEWGLRGAGGGLEATIGEVEERRARRGMLREAESVVFAAQQRYAGGPMDSGDGDEMATGEA